MNKRQMKRFIKSMKKMGDEWNLKQVEDAYGDYELEEALDERKGEIGSLIDAIQPFLDNGTLSKKDFKKRSIFGKLLK